jgi:hypothetical protein
MNFNVSPFFTRGPKSLIRHCRRTSPLTSLDVISCSCCLRVKVNSRLLRSRPYGSAHSYCCPVTALSLESPWAVGPRQNFSNFGDSIAEKLADFWLNLS